MFTFLCFTLNKGGSSAEKDTPLRAQFQWKYQVWLNAQNTWIKENPAASFTGSVPEEKAVVDMGPQAVPFLIEILEKDLNNRQMGFFLQEAHIKLCIRITKKRLMVDCPKGVSFNLYIQEQLINWWKERKLETPKKFDRFYEEWDQFLDQKKTHEADEAQNKIIGMGMEILPLLMNKIQKGDDRLVPFISKMMGQPIGGEPPTRKGILEWWDANKSKLTYPDSPKIKRPGAKLPPFCDIG